MRHRIFGDNDGTSVIIEDSNRLIKLNFKILKGFLHLEELDPTCDEINKLKGSKRTPTR